MVGKLVGYWPSLLLATLGSSACDPGDSAATPAWHRVHADLPGALLSVWGTGANDVWAVGADGRDGDGPLVLHYDGQTWQRVATGQTAGDLWWVFGFAQGPVYMGGDGGVILRWQDQGFESMQTPGTDTVFGLWGSSPQEMWAVGGASDATGGFAWRLHQDRWVAEPSLPPEVAKDAALWKVSGTSNRDAWLVGSNGVALHWDGDALEAGRTGVGSSLFTVHAHGDRYAAVGGLATGIIVELEDGTWHNRTPDPAPMGLAGVTLAPDDGGLAVGMFGSIYTRDRDQWNPVPLEFAVPQNLHGSWIDDEGGLWAVGGQTLTKPLTDGVLLHRGTSVSNEGL